MYVLKICPEKDSLFVNIFPKYPFVCVLVETRTVNDGMMGLSHWSDCFWWSLIG